MIQCILPFGGPQLEQAFLESYHKKRARYDAAIFLLSVLAVIRKLIWPDLLLNDRVASLWRNFAVLNLVVLICTAHPWYPSRRPYVMLLLRGLSFALMFWSVREGIGAVPAPTFSSAAFKVLANVSRWKLPLYIATLYQVPFGSHVVMIQTVLLAFLLSHSSQECAMLVSKNKDFAAFALQVENNYNVWKLEGSSAACRDMCSNLLGISGWRCMRPCGLLLPALWTVYGAPWQHACIMHRYVFGVTLGYALPLVGLLVWEVMERHAFAEARNAGVAPLGTCMRLAFESFLWKVCESTLLVLICTVQF